MTALSFKINTLPPTFRCDYYTPAVVPRPTKEAKTDSYTLHLINNIG